MVESASHFCCYSSHIFLFYKRDAAMRRIFAGNIFYFGKRSEIKSYNRTLNSKHWGIWKQSSTKTSSNFADASSAMTIWQLWGNLQGTCRSRMNSGVVLSIHWISKLIKIVAFGADIEQLNPQLRTNLNNRTINCNIEISGINVNFWWTIVIYRWLNLRSE